MNRIKTNDTVFILTGKDKGKTGTVIEILSEKGKVKVKGLAMVFKHAKARKAGESSSIKKIESFIASSNVMPVCVSCRKPVRVGYKDVDGKGKLRVCNHCGHGF